MFGQQSGGRESAAASDRSVWARCRAAEAVGDEEETERFLDLAGFAEGSLDAEDHARIAEFLAAYPDAAADVAAARSIVPEAPSEAVIARAAALVREEAVADQGGVVVRLAQRRHERRLPGVARWASLAAAVAVASWLGFSLGVDTSRSFSQIAVQAGVAAAPAADDGGLRDLLDPSTGFLRELTGGAQT
jgi:anti-sigma factor RsiW